MNRFTKNIILVFALLSVVAATAQVDRSKAPESGPAPKIHLGDYDSFTLKNGLKVLVVENDKVPKVSFNLSLNIDPVVEGDKAGYVSLVGDLLDKGTLKRDNQQIAQEIDFIGARLGTYSRGAYASGLSRYKEKIMEIMADVVINPSFPQNEFEKIIKQTLSGLKSNESDPKAIARNVRARVLYGGNHPYGDVTTRSTVKNITLDDCKRYYNSFFKPNVGILTIVGDISTKQAKKMVKKYFGEWKEGNVPVNTYPQPDEIKGKRVVLSHKEAAPQSTIQVVHTVDLKKGAADVIPVRVMNAMLGRGFMGLLTKNLREDKGYTYGAGSSISSDKLVGRFYAGAEVGRNVTDSALIEIAREMNHIRNERMTQDHLDMTKATLAGDFARSLEDPSTIAEFALSIEKYGLDKDYYATYLQRISQVTLDDVKAMAQKYVDPDNAIYLVVGDRALKSRLASLSSSNNVEEYDHEGNVVKQDENAIPHGVTAISIIESYLNAIGGKQHIANVKDMTMKGEMKMGPMSMSVESYYKNNKKYALKMLMNGQVMQAIAFNGKKARVISMGQKKDVDRQALKSFARQAQIVPEMNFNSEEYQLKLIGLDNVEGEKAYKVEVMGPDHKKRLEFYAAQSGLKVKTVAQENGMTQEVVYKDYKEVEGVKFPFTQVTSVGPQEMPMTITEMKINSGVEDEIFN